MGETVKSGAVAVPTFCTSLGKSRQKIYVTNNDYGVQNDESLREDEQD